MFKTLIDTTLIYNFDTDCACFAGIKTRTNRMKPKSFYEFKSSFYKTDTKIFKTKTIIYRHLCII